MWAGRFLPPSDRFNLDGPYFLNAYNFPIVQAYPALENGRDNGCCYYERVWWWKIQMVLWHV